MRAIILSFLSRNHWFSPFPCCSVAFLPFNKKNANTNMNTNMNANLSLWRWWKPIEQTPIEKYDLITTLNSRGTFATTKAVLPYMRENGWGHVLCQSPPIVLDSFAGKTAYNISKFGMTMTALGVAAEYKGLGVCSFCLTRVYVWIGSGVLEFLAYPFSLLFVCWAVSCRLLAIAFGQIHW